MGGTPKKPAELRQGRGTKDAGAVVPKASGVVPQADAAWREGTVERWVAFWGSNLAGQVEVSDHVALRRLFALYDETDRLWDAVNETGRVVAGSQGQPRANPLLEMVLKLQQEARQLEDRFGLSPLSRLRLGITFADAASSLDALNERLAAKLAQSDDLWEGFGE